MKAGILQGWFFSDEADVKISDVKAYPIWVGHRNQLVVKVETDEGLFGLGESGLSGRELAVVGAVKHYREFLIGRDPRHIGALWQEMYRSQYFEGGRVLTAAIAAIDIALHDIVAKSLNIPVYQLLGGKHREAIPCFATCGMPSYDELLANVRLLLDSGWNVIRTMMGDPRGEEGVFEPRESIGVTSEWLTQLRQDVGSAPTIGIEYHHRLSVAEAASFCQRMPSGTVDFIEEPIRDESPESYEALRRMTDVPFAIGEEFASKWQFAPYLERGITQFARLDVCNVGGLTESMKVASLAETHYIDLMPHNPLGPICTAASVHFAAAVPNFAWLEYRITPTDSVAEFDREMFPIQLMAEGDRISVPDAPGLGIEFNEELAKEKSFEFWEAPHLRRTDGSYTNW